jgi:PAS domain-containing protein
MACVTAVTISLSLGVFDLFALRRGMARDITTLADVLARNSTAALTFRDTKAAEEVLHAVEAESSIITAGIYAADGSIFVQYSPNGNAAHGIPPLPPSPGTKFEHQHLIAVRLIVLNDEKLGTIYIDSDLRELNGRLQEYLVTIVLTLVIALSLASFIAARLQRPISEPLGALVRTAETITQENDYSLRASLCSRDEFGVLVNAFNEMLGQIESRNKELREHREQLEMTVAARTGDLVKANQQLREAEEKYRTIFEDAVIGIFQTTVDGRPLSANRALAQMHGYDSPEEYMASVANVTDLFVHPEQMEELRQVLEQKE